MATDKTRTVSARVPEDIATALESDATDLGTFPGTIIRQLLEGRYSARRTVEKIASTAAKRDERIEELADA